MRVLLIAIVMAFFGSWALAEWLGRTTHREFVSVVENFYDDHLVVLPFEIWLDRVTIVDGNGAPVTSPPTFTKGQPVTVTLRCQSNSLSGRSRGFSGCSPERIRLH